MFAREKLDRTCEHIRCTASCFSIGEVVLETHGASCCFTVVAQQSTQPLTLLYGSTRFSLPNDRHDQSVFKSLMIALLVRSGTICRTSPGQDGEPTRLPHSRRSRFCHGECHRSPQRAPPRDHAFEIASTIDA